MTRSQLIELIERADGHGLILVEPHAAAQLADRILAALEDHAPGADWEPGELQERLEHNAEEAC